MKLLGIDNNAKTIKGQRKGYRTAIMYLAPSNVSGAGNTCTSASKGCRKSCLYLSGRGRMNPIQEARINKTKFFFNNPEEFLLQLEKETAAFIKSSNKKNLIPCERLNGTSDVKWEDILFDDGLNIFQKFPELQFYDYTKHFSRAIKFAKGELPSNYHLTFSRSENTSDEQVVTLLGLGVNVAVVYENELPAQDFGGWEVINGDESDLRFKDKQAKIVGLIYKNTPASEEEKGDFVRKPLQLELAA